MAGPVVPAYAPTPVKPARGLGNWLYEEDGTAWLDGIGGIAVNALGRLVTPNARAAA